MNENILKMKPSGIRRFTALAKATPGCKMLTIGEPDFDTPEPIRAAAASAMAAGPWGLLCPWGFSRQEYWSGLPFPSPGALPDPGIEPRSPALQADALTSEPPGKHVR